MGVEIINLPSDDDIGGTEIIPVVDPSDGNLGKSVTIDALRLYITADEGIGTNTLSTSNSGVLVDHLNVFPSGTANLIVALPQNPSPGDKVYVSNLSGETTNQISGNGQSFQGDPTNLVLDDATASFGLIFFNTQTGWVVVGSN